MKKQHEQPVDYPRISDETRERMLYQERLRKRRSQDREPRISLRAFAIAIIMIGCLAVVIIQETA